MRGPNAGSQFLLDQPVTSAGRHPDSDIFLDDATVSRRHVEFRLENGQFLLVDLDSLNNTYVNHEPVDSAVLVNGDEIQIGKFRLVFLTRPTTAETRTFRWIGACAHPDDAVKSCSAGWGDFHQCGRGRLDHRVTSDTNRRSRNARIYTS